MATLHIQTLAAIAFDMIWIIITLLILYGLGLYFWDTRTSRRVGNKFSNGIKYFHYTLFGLTIIAAILNVIDATSFRGPWTTRIIILGFLLSGILIYPLSNWTAKARLEKIYFKLFSVLPLVTGVFSFVPFLGVVIVFSLLGRLIDPVKEIYYEDNKMRVQSTFTGVLAPPRLDIIEKKGLFETRLNALHFSAADLDSVGIDHRTNNTWVLLYIGQEVVDTIKVKKVE